MFFRTRSLILIFVLVEGVSLRRRKSSEDSTKSPQKRATVDLGKQTSSSTVFLPECRNSWAEEVLMPKAEKRKSLEPLIPRKSSRILDDNEEAITETISNASVTPGSFKEQEGVQSQKEHDMCSQTPETPRIEPPSLISSPDSPAFKDADVFLFRNVFDTSEEIAKLSLPSIDQDKNRQELAKETETFLASEFEDIFNYLEEEQSSSRKQRLALSLSDGNSDLETSTSFEDSGEFTQSCHNYRASMLPDMSKLNTLPSFHSRGSSYLGKYSSQNERKPAPKKMLFRRSMSDCERKANKRGEARSQSLKHKLFRQKSVPKSSEESLFKGILRKSKKQNQRSLSDGSDRGRTFQIFLKKV